MLEQQLQSTEFSGSSRPIYSVTTLATVNQMLWLLQKDVCIVTCTIKTLLMEQYPFYALTARYPGNEWLKYIRANSSLGVQLHTVSH